MKRTIALMLALIMICSITLPAFADGEPDADATPEPEVTATPEPEPEATATPEPEATTVPEPEATATPEPEATVVPEPEATATPEPEATATPEPEATATPEPEATAAPEPSPSATPEPELLLAMAGLEDVYATVGRLDLSIHKAMDPDGVTPAFTVTLARDGASGEQKSVPADGGTYSFSVAEEADYVLSVCAPGFAAYTQTIHISLGECARIMLLTGKVAGYESKAHPGVLQIGDVNGDGAVNDADRGPMMRSVAAGAAVDGCCADLNMDGRVDLADAEYLARGLDVGGMDADARLATVERFIPADMIKPAVSENTAVTGNVDDLLRDNGQSVQFGTADGQPISPEAPVQVSFAVPDKAKTDVILLEDTNIANGEILITYFDEALGMEVVAKGVIGQPVVYAPAAVIAAPVTAAQTEMTVPAAEPEQTQEPLPEPVAVTETEEPGAEIIAEPIVPAAMSPWVLRRSSGATMLSAPIVTGTVEVVPDGAGNFTVKLGGQKAVKRVTLTITSTSDELDLAEISQVEFVNGMENRISEPALDIPVMNAPAGGSRQFTISWQPCQNITGYEVRVSDGVHAPETYSLTGTSLTVTNFNKDEVLNYTTYTAQVRSVNGSWTSPDWSAAVSVTPKPTGAPDKPDNVKATGAYQSVVVSWKNMKDTTSYDLYYKAETEAQYSKVPDLTVTSYTIGGLDSSKPTNYMVYVIGKNEIGQSAPSMLASARTVTLAPPEMSRFNLINRSASGVPGPYHIESAAQSSGTMLSSSMDSGAGTAWGTVDGDPASYYDRHTWDDGGYNGSLGSHLGLTYTFDGVYKIDTIGMMSAVDAGMDYTYIQLRWWEGAGTEHFIDRSQMYSEKRTDAEGRHYFFIRLPGPVEAKKIQIGTARYWAGNNRINVSEVYFYKYDSLKQELNALYTDDLHMTLADTVTEQLLDQLQARIESSVDEFGEVNPDKAQLLRELDTARQIYNDQFKGRVIQIHTGITASGDEHGFGGLNAWQPLGVTAAAGESVTVYVGSPGKKTGSGTNLQLVATQYHAESSAMSKVLLNLKVGANEIKLPKIWTTTGVESGGALYVQYTGGAGSSEQYAVRVSGGVAVPVLDLYKVTDPGERSARTADYLSQLGAYAAGIQAKHAEVHQGEGAVSVEVNYDYSERDCILGATDIMLDTMMLSIPAQQVLAGCGGDAVRLLASLNAMENMMALFYQHKGLNAAAPDAVDRIPNRHLNIRYQRMFSGAFMYASGDHIGIEWPETAGIAGCGGVTADANGLYQSGNYFGWGIAHEIGHDINQGTYAIAEVTNNYFAVLAQAQDSNGSVRFEYPKVYEKVTSGTKGSAGNVFTQLAMYWQLHLAYDKGYNFKTYADYDQQLASLFWARVDTYARTPSKAPGKLTLEGADMDQRLMRLCCAAAQKDILDFFVRWGKTPDEGTAAYASQFEKETRAIWYVCDDSRRYTIEHSGPSRLNADGSTQAVGQITAAADAGQTNRVDISIAPGGVVAPEEVLGYEIVRCTIAGGKVERRTVGFTTDGSFTDVVTAMNNRAVYYEITLVDKYLERSAPAVTGTVKIQHEGDLDKSGWTVTTDGLKADPILSGGTSADDPEQITEDAAVLLADNRADTVYSALVEKDGASIQISFGQTQVISGFRYSAGGAAIGGYVMDVRQNGQWLRAAEGTLGSDKTVYFANPDGKYVSTYSADAMRLTLTGQAGQTVSAAELTALGLTGDNVDFRYGGGSAVIGYLSEAYKYGDEPGDYIPKGSLVFTGSYKGNAAYNTVVLYDQNGGIVAGRGADGTQRAYQTIMADLPDTGSIQDVADGFWVYWIQPEDLTMDFALPQKVRVELYRVNDAMNNEGHRLVSDSMFVDMPQPLGSITLGNG